MRYVREAPGGRRAVRSAAGTTKHVSGPELKAPRPRASTEDVLTTRKARGLLALATDAETAFHETTDDEGLTTSWFPLPGLSKGRSSSQRTNRYIVHQAVPPTETALSVEGREACTMLSSKVVLSQHEGLQDEEHKVHL